MLEVREPAPVVRRRRAIDGVSLPSRAAEIVAIIGPNGAGKSTLFNLITGHLRPDAGSVRLGGRDVTGMAPHRLCALGVGTVVPAHQHLPAPQRLRERAGGAHRAPRPRPRRRGRAPTGSSATRRRRCCAT